MTLSVAVNKNRNAFVICILLPSTDIELSIFALSQGHISHMDVSESCVCP